MFVTLHNYIITKKNITDDITVDNSTWTIRNPIWFKLLFKIFKVDFKFCIKYLILKKITLIVFLLYIAT